MSRFINYNLEPEGILTVPIVEIVKGFDRTRNRLEGEELSRIMEKFSSQEKNLLNSTNGRNMMVRCGALKKKLYRYARCEFIPIQLFVVTCGESHAKPARTTDA